MSGRVMRIGTCLGTLGLLSCVAACREDDPAERVRLENRPLVVDHQSALLVVGDPTLRAADVAIKDRLESAGLRVEVVLDTNAQGKQGVGRRLIVISESARSANVGTKFRDVPTPVLIAEPNLGKEMGFSRGRWSVDAGDKQGQTQLTFPRSSRPFAHQVTASPGINGDPEKYVWESPSGEFTGIAHIQGQPTQWAVFAYEGNAMMHELRAPARRVGFFLGSDAASSLTTTGWMVFDAAVRWAAAPRAALVIGTGEISAADQRLKLRLQTVLGFDVRVVAAGHVDAEQVSGMRIIVVSESCLSTDVGSRLKGVAVPAVVAEPALFDDFDMTGPSWMKDFGDFAAATRLNVFGAHPLAAGLSGDVEVLETPLKIVWGVPASQAIRVASILGQPDRLAVFAYEEGARMVHGKASARRVGLFPGRDAATAFTANGWKLFDAAVRWASQVPDPANPCSGAANGTSCSDGNSCNGEETCQAETCVAGPPISASHPEFEQCSTSEVTIEALTKPLELVATRVCTPWPNPGSTPGLQTPSTPVKVRIPSSLQVTLGNAGNHEAVLSITRPSGEVVRCSYRGAASSGHPTDVVDRAKGLEYRLASCESNLDAGAELLGSHFRLDILGSDCTDSPWKTMVSTHLGSSGCDEQLEPPLNAAETARLRADFSWADTNAVAERDSEGRPALYYGLIYIEDREQLAALEQLYIHHSPLPIFAVERDRWAGQCGHFSFEGDGKGSFVYALILGETYNYIRFHALNPDPVEGDATVFRVVRLLTVPDSRVMNPEGSIRFDMLAQFGFRFMDRDDFPDDETTEVHQFPFFFSAARKIVRGGAKLLRGAAREFTRGLGAIDRFFAGSINVDVDLTILNRDPLFDRAAGMQRGWGRDAGKEAKLQGVRIELNQWMQFGDVTTPIPTKFYGHTGQDGKVRVKIAKNRGAVRDICVAATNDYVEVTSLFTEDMVCSFDRKLIVATDKDLKVALRSNDRTLHVMNAMVDANLYRGLVFKGAARHQAIVLRGTVANMVGALNGNAAFTPCFDLGADLPGRQESSRNLLNFIEETGTYRGTYGL